MDSEYEVRVLDINQEEFKTKLEVLQAQYIDSYHQVRFIYDFNPKIENKWIRLRTDCKKTTLAIKEYQDTSIGGTKEIEIEVSDMKKTDLILQELGYTKRSIQENKRIRYVLDNVEIDIDTWPHLNTYVEFEGSNEQQIFNLLKKLNIDKNQITTMDAQDIYLSKGYTLEELNNLTFENN